MSLHYGFGALELPQDGVLSDASLVKRLDPNLDLLLDYFTSVIRAEFDEIFNQAKIGTSLEDSPSVVSTALPLAVSSSVLDRIKPQYPLLGLSRSGEGVYDDWTLAHGRLRQTWELDYLLGPLDLKDERRLGAILTAISKSVVLSIDRGFHESFNEGVSPFFGGKAYEAFLSIKVLTHRIGKARLAAQADAPELLALYMQIQTEEVYECLDQWPDTEGMSLAIESEEDDGSTWFYGEV